MVTAITLAPDEPAAPQPDTARRCLVTGETLPKHELIRFVLAPDHTVVPDLAHNLPGRGLWVTAMRDRLDDAAQRNLFARAAKAPAKVPAGLVDQVAGLYRKRVLDLLGLAKGAGIAVLGQTQVEAGLRAGQLNLLFIADDAALGGLEKLGSSTLEQIRLFTRHELGAALGYEQIVYVGVMPHGLNRNMKQALEILAKLVIKDGDGSAGTVRQQRKRSE